MLLATNCRYYLERFTQEEMSRMAEEDLAKLIDAMSFTLQFKATVRRFQKRIPRDSPALKVIAEVTFGLSQLQIFVAHHFRDEPDFSGIEAWARRDLDNKLLEQRWCDEDGEFEIIKQALNAIRQRLERLELYEDCAKVRDSAKALGIQHLLELINGKE